MNLLFPQNPMMRKLPEPIFEPEFDAAKSLGFSCFLFDEEALSAGDIDLAFKRLPRGDGGETAYRGWILTEELYGQFHEALSARGYPLVSSAAQYAEVTYFPNYYPKIREVSPKSRVLVISGCVGMYISRTCSTDILGFGSGSGCPSNTNSRSRVVTFTDIVGLPPANSEID